MWLVTYTGDVTPGGPSDLRELPLLKIRKASDPERIMSLLREGGGTGDLELIVTTHGHWDHHRALAQVAASTNAMTAAGAADADALPVIPSRRLTHGHTLSFGDITLDVIQLRGHTPGSVALAYQDPQGTAHIWTGDSLFPGGVGNVEQDPERFASLWGDVRSRLFEVYADDTWIYPGHGADTTLGAERPHLQEWRERGW